MNFFKDVLQPFKKPLLIVACFAIVFLILGKGIPAIRDAIVGQSQITGIEAENEKEYSKTSTIKASDFDVFYLHENGKKTRMRTKEVTLSKDKPNKATGGTSCKKGSFVLEKEAKILMSDGSFFALFEEANLYLTAWENYVAHSFIKANEEAIQVEEENRRIAWLQRIAY